MTIYRDIYEQHYGPISFDKSGRTLEIHHKDGNRNNNDIGNLVALTIDEHFDIHYKQGDWAACLAISMRMKKTPEEISKIQSEIGKKSALQRKTNGTNPYCYTGKKHHRYGKKHSSETKEKIKAARAKQVISKESYEKASLSKTGIKRTNNMKERMSKAQKEYQLRNICICPHCHSQGPKPQMTRWHFDNCKEKVF